MTTKLKAVLGVLGALVAAGVACWAYQLMNGLGVTGMSNANSWGLYIICFMFMVGLSAGGLIVASSASVFHVAEYKKVALPAIILSTVCICMAGMFVLIDLGGIQRVWRILTGPNPVSPLFWDICVIT
ncbi:MAG TPA: polysulfide reductase NrfD, partial [Candidatus Aveggerthella excrementigallinarum]|nr:polysulfide reductase NrfD [Candidatus Aveggerthella excrementigallinarum]